MLGLSDGRTWLFLQNVDVTSHATPSEKMQSFDSHIRNLIAPLKLTQLPSLNTRHLLSQIVSRGVIQNVLSHAMFMFVFPFPILDTKRYCCWFLFLLLAKEGK